MINDIQENNESSSYVISKDKVFTTTMFTTPKHKTEINFGELTIYSSAHFNALQKKMIKIFFGFDVKDIN